MDNALVGLIIIVSTLIFGWMVGSFFMILGFFIGAIFLVIGLIEPAMNRKRSKSSSDRYCPDCGCEIPFNALFCPYCGKKFEIMNVENHIDE